MKEVLETVEETENVNGIFTGDRGEREEFVAPYQFDVIEEEMTTDSGIIVPNRRAIIRSDTMAVMGTVGTNYKILSHAEALDPILDELKRKKIKTFQRVALTAGGAKMFANIYFPGQEINLSNDASRKDNCWPGITVVNSLDGTLKYSLEATIYRLACTNGMRVPTAIASSKTTHSINKDYTRMVEEIIASVSNTDKFVTLQKWANNVLTADAMGLLAEKIVKTKGSMFPARYLDEVNDEIKREESYGVVSVWGLYNAFNSVLEHNLVRGKGKLERARMLDENLFKVFTKTFK